MGDETQDRKDSGSGARRRRQAAEPPSAEATTPTAPPPVPADPVAEEGQGGPLLEEDDTHREKLDRDLIISRSERWLGIPRHEMVGALSLTEDTEMTLTAARKAHAAWRGQVSNLAGGEG